MKLTLSEICKYGECTITSRNFSEGEKLLNSDYVIKCGRIATESIISWHTVANTRQSMENLMKSKEALMSMVLLPLSIALAKLV